MGYPKQVYDKAWNNLARRREAARGKARAHREEIYRNIPEIAEIEREMAALAASVGKMIIASPQKAGEYTLQLGQESLALQERRRTLLAKRGYPGDYLEQQYGCAECRDSGYTGVRMCNCFQKMLRQEAAVQLSAVSGAEKCRFGNFLLDYYPGEPVDSSGVVPRARMEEVLAACAHYAETFTTDSDNLLLLGRTGLGKTHLSLAIAATVTEAGYGVVYTPAQRLMDALEAERFGRGEQRGSANPRFALDCDLLVLDDLGTEFATQFTSSMLYNIVNTRLVERRPTIISTNLELAAMEEKYSQRMVSRLICSYQVIKFYGKDIRFQKKMRE